ncbi:MAG: hypothetical protein JXQ73_23825 [Phycisphaerae bacterium]|nr:hypothetical protein [Phycisphaerae bacterium]
MPLTTVARLGLKLVGVYLLIRGGMDFVSNGAPLLIEQGSGWPIRGWIDAAFGQCQAVLPPLVMALSGAVMLGGPPWLLARLVPGGRSACTECGYSLVGLTAPRCPECGTPVVLPGSALTFGDRVRLQRPLVRVVVKLFGVVVIVVSCSNLICWLLSAGPSLRSGSWRGSEYVIWRLGLDSLVLASGYFLLFRAGWPVISVLQCDSFETGGAADDPVGGLSGREIWRTLARGLVCLTGVCMVMRAADAIAWTALLLHQGQESLFSRYVPRILASIALLIGAVYLVVWPDRLAERALGVGRRRGSGLPDGDDGVGDEPRSLARVLLALLGVYLLILTAWHLSTDVVYLVTMGSAGGDRDFWQKHLAIGGFVCSCVMGLAGLYLLFRGRWVIERMVLGAGPPCGDDGANGGVGETVLGRSGQMRRHKEIVQGLLTLLGIYFLVTGVASLCYAAIWASMLFTNVQWRSPLYMSNVLRPAVNLIVGGYLVFGGRWLVERLVLGDWPDLSECASEDQ